MANQETRLSLWLAVQDGLAVLDRMEFTHPQLPADRYPRQTAAVHRGKNGFQWREGAKSLVAFLLHARLAAANGTRHSAYPFSGHRPSVASTLNDLVTSPPNWISKAFGERMGTALFPDLTGRSNGDFKSDPQGKVRIWLLDAMCPGYGIHVFVDGVELSDRREIESYIDNVCRQWRATGSPTPLPPIQQLSTSDSSTGADTVPDNWRRRIDQLDSAADFSVADRLWGDACSELLRMAADPEREQHLEKLKPAGRWETLAVCQIKLRRGRWTQVVKLLDPLLQRQAPLSERGADAAWVGRAAAMLAIAAHRQQNRQTVRDCFAMLRERAFADPAQRTPLRAQYLHYQGRVWMDENLDVEAESYLLQSRDLYENLDATSPWRMIGLSQVCDTLGQFHLEHTTAQQSRELFLESLQHKKALGDLYGQAITCGKLGRMHCELYELDRAASYLQQDLELCDRMHDLRNKAVVLVQLADVCLLRAEGSSETDGALNQASRYLDQAWPLASELENDVLLGMIEVGRARRLVRESSVNTHDGSGPAATLTLAERHAENAARLLRKTSTGGHLAAHAQVWRGWAKARLASTSDELRTIDDSYFVPAIAHLAGRPVAEAEARFQRARMLLSEGARLGYIPVEDAVDCFAAAVETANALGADGLAQRYLDVARVIQPADWIQLVRRHRKTVESLTHARRKLQLELEQQFATALLFAHDLKNPLDNLRSIVPLAKSRDPAWDKAAVHLERLAAIHEMMELMEELREVSLDPGRDSLLRLAKPIDVAAVGRRVADRVQRLYRHIGVAVQGPSSGPLEFPTAGLVLEHILHNLVDNAARAAATAEPGSRCVSLEVYRQDTGDLVFEVCNSGMPLNAEQADRIFQPGRGSGSCSQRESKHRGLYMSREFARRLNGDISLLDPPPRLAAAFQLSLATCPNMDSPTSGTLYSR